MALRIYIAGPMRGVEKFNFPLFFKVEGWLREHDWEPVSPAQMDVMIDGLDPLDPHPNEDLGIDYYMQRDLPAVRSCDAVAMLPGWEGSTGANRELAEARKHGKEIFSIGTDKHGDFLLVAAPGLLPDPSKLKPEGGINLDAGKLRVDLVPMSAIRAIATILGESAQPKGKYPARNWEKGIPWMRNIASALRHIMAILEGEDVDPESGFPHSYHALTRLAMQVELERTGKGEDDRPAKAAA